VIGPFFGLPLIGRYVRTPAVLLTLFYGLAVCGWMLLAPGRERRIWTAVGGVAAALSLVFLPWHVGMVGDLRDSLDARARAYAQMRRAATAPAMRAAVRACGPLVTASDHRPIPHLRWWLDTPPFSVGTVEAGASPLRRVTFAPRDVPAMRRFYASAFPRFEPPEQYRPVFRNRSWRASAAPECVIARGSARSHAGSGR
jgi:hypothetical protein